MNKHKSFVGIVTWYASGNYGTNLQAYALMQAIQNIGYECSLIAPLHSYAPTVRQKARNIMRPLYRKIRPLGKLNEETERFVNENLSIVNVYRKTDYDNLMQSSKAFVTGSDQVWNPYYLNSFYMLDFVRGARRVAYAPSVGVKEIPRRKAAAYQKWLPRYDAISVREQAGADAIQQLLPDLHIQRVLDPTLLLDAPSWRSIALNASTVRMDTPYVLCYVVGTDDTNIKRIQKLWIESGIGELLIIPSAENPEIRIRGAHVLSHIGPLEFIDLIDNAALVCTDSFHATALCITLKTPFAELMRFHEEDPSSQNSRVNELLESFGLCNRLVRLNNRISLDIDDLTKANTLLECERNKSKRFLIDSIKGPET